MNKNSSDAEWLTKILSENLPNESPDEISAISQEILSSVDKFAEIFKAGQAARMRGLSPQEWITDNVREATIGLSEQDFGDRLAKLDAAIHHSNEELAKTLTTKSGAINMNPNLDGLLAETEHANSFNRAAALSNSQFEARVLKSNAKNSVDVGIYDGSNHLAQRYQLKFCADAGKKLLRRLRRAIIAVNKLLCPPNSSPKFKKRSPTEKFLTESKLTASRVSR